MALPKTTACVVLPKEPLTPTTLIVARVPAVFLVRLRKEALSRFGNRFGMTFVKKDDYVTFYKEMPTNAYHRVAAEGATINGGLLRHLGVYSTVHRIPQEAIPAILN